MKRDRRQITKDRFERQFRFFAKKVPMLEGLRKPGWIIARLILGVLLVIGGMLAILPILNVWMIPVGLLLLAIDLPVLQGPLARAIIKGRRRFEIWRRTYLRSYAW